MGVQAQPGINPYQQPMNMNNPYALPTPPQGQMMMGSGGMMMPQTQPYMTPQGQMMMPQTQPYMTPQGQMMMPQGAKTPQNSTKGGIMGALGNIFSGGGAQNAAKGALKGAAAATLGIPMSPYGSTNPYGMHPGMNSQYGMGMPGMNPGMNPQYGMGMPGMNPGMNPQYGMGMSGMNPGMNPQYGMGMPGMNPGMNPQYGMGMSGMNPGMNPQYGMGMSGMNPMASSGVPINQNGCFDPSLFPCNKCLNSQFNMMSRGKCQQYCQSDHKLSYDPLMSQFDSGKYKVKSSKNHTKNSLNRGLDFESSSSFRSPYSSMGSQPYDSFSDYGDLEFPMDFSEQGFHRNINPYESSRGSPVSGYGSSNQPYGSSRFPSQPPGYPSQPYSPYPSYGSGSTHVPPQSRGFEGMPPQRPPIPPYGGRPIGR